MTTSVETRSRLSSCFPCQPVSPRRRETQKKPSKQMGYHSGITAGTHLSCAAKSGGWRTKLSRTAVRTMGQARGNNHAGAGLPFGRGCGCRPPTRAGKQPTPWCRCLTDWPRIWVGLFGMTTRRLKRSMIDASQPPCPIFDSDLASCGEVSWFKFCCSPISFFSSVPNSKVHVRACPDCTCPCVICPRHGPFSRVLLRTRTTIPQLFFRGSLNALQRSSS